MCRNISPRMQKERPAHSQLTEANLRVHASSQALNNQMHEANECPRQAARNHSYEDLYDDMDESQDGDANAKRHMLAVRRAASLQALNAYGGCFASGFLAMQDPLPWSKHSSYYDDAESLDLQTLASEMSSVERKSKKTAASNAHDRVGNPRPDSGTLSHADVRELEKMRKWSWKSFGQRRRNSGS